ncbi:IclR family transcriptional regulator, partial [Nostocoides japonicum]|uniref:IclR family transcriptional regulator n=1 Tax=Nostocoides japonicum TaxID=99481 RepID=UPI00065B9635
MTQESDIGPYVQSVDRAVELLGAIAAAGSASSLTELAHECGLHRSTAWRLLVTLERQRLVVRDPRRGRFVLGPRITELAAVRTHSDIVHAAQPVLEQLSLETGEVACLGVVEDDQVSYVGEVIPPLTSEPSWIGMPVVLHASSMGKAFLAAIPEPRALSIVGEHLTRYTDSTLTTWEELRADLQRTRGRGYAVCRGELEEGSWGVAAPIVAPTDGGVVAVLCLWGPDRRGDETRLAALGRLARRSAREL